MLGLALRMLALAAVGDSTSRRGSAAGSGGRRGVPTADQRPINAQLYPCSDREPFAKRQSWSLMDQSDVSGSAIRFLDGSRRALILQPPPMPVGSASCPAKAARPVAGAACLNVIVAEPSVASPALRFQLTARAQLQVVGGSAAAAGLCLAGSWWNSAGVLPNVLLTDCWVAGDSWTVNGSTIRSTKGQNESTPDHKHPWFTPLTQCLDLGSGGSVGDLEFRLEVLPASPPARQAFNSRSYVSWGGSVIEDDDGRYHMFMAGFAGQRGLSDWKTASEVLHAVASTPEGPFQLVNSTSTAGEAGVLGSLAGCTPPAKRCKDHPHSCCEPPAPCAPQPCPAHPGRTFCPSDPAPHQCDSPPRHGPCPPGPCGPPPPRASPGVVASPEAHNPTIIRANDGTYLLFFIGSASANPTHLWASRSLYGPWRSMPNFPPCNAPSPVVVEGEETIYVFCHCGVTPSTDCRSSIGLVHSPRWNSSSWSVFQNNSEDLYDGGRALFAHPAEDPCVLILASSLSYSPFRT